MKKPSEISVLVLEDEIAIGRLIVTILERQGVKKGKIDLASNEEEVNKFLASTKLYDLIIADTMDRTNNPYGPKTVEVITRGLQQYPIIVATSGEAGNKHYWSGVQINYWIDKPEIVSPLIKILKIEFPSEEFPEE